MSKAALFSYYYREDFKISKNSSLIPQEFQFLLSMNYANFFEQTGESWLLDFRCKGCGEKVKQWERESHFKRHKNTRNMMLEANRVAASIARETVTGDTRIDICTNCGESFEQERKRGRPRKQCFKCLPPKEG